MKTPAQANARWKANTAGATQTWLDGVNGYNGDWANATTSQQGVLLQNVTQAITNGTWAAGVNKKGTQGWKTDTAAKSANFGVGVAAAGDRQLRAITNVMNAEATIVSGLPPRGDFNQNVQRSVQVQTQLHALKGQLGA